MYFLFFDHIRIWFFSGGLEWIRVYVFFLIAGSGFGQWQPGSSTPAAPGLTKGNFRKLNLCTRNIIRDTQYSGSKVRISLRVNREQGNSVLQEYNSDFPQEEYNTR